MGTVGYLGLDMAMEGLIQMQKMDFILDFFFYSNLVGCEMFYAI
jgi:hypothetical protein